MSDSWWGTINGSVLAQGDLLMGCRMPSFEGVQSFAVGDSLPNEVLKQANLIVVTQSCDLESKSIEFVATCPIHRLEEFEAVNPKYAKKKAWEGVRKGQVAALHLLASPETPDDSRQALVVDFGHIVSLPFEYLSHHAESLENRYRLESPFLEHFSQAFARFFMRVGLPASIPPFTY